ncbi:hypothetical protein THRCLA_20076 [Thraustotheca clavata]|uniref:Uncharacterized protein n=1 Tax=Thraustotheca clavata TaxID=74557 RepID=A0A1W0ABS5_9STRA|nr:hypothetical protein THRCLA_20076 [Thraustotheca clavata]
MAILIPMNDKTGAKTKLNDGDDLPPAKRIKLNSMVISKQQSHGYSSDNLPRESKSCETFWTDEIPIHTIRKVENEVRSWREAIYKGDSPDACETCDRWELLEENEDGSPSYHDCMEFLFNAMLQPQNTRN